jgi:hypothetical protein
MGQLGHVGNVAKWTAKAVWAWPKENRREDFSAELEERIGKRFMILGCCKWN